MDNKKISITNLVNDLPVKNWMVVVSEDHYQLIAESLKKKVNRKCQLSVISRLTWNFLELNVAMPITLDLMVKFEQDKLEEFVNLDDLLSFISRSFPSLGATNIQCFYAVIYLFEKKVIEASNASIDERLAMKSNVQKFNIGINGIENIEFTNALHQGSISGYVDSTDNLESLGYEHNVFQFDGDTLENAYVILRHLGLSLGANVLKESVESNLERTDVHQCNCNL